VRLYLQESVKTDTDDEDPTGQRIGTERINQRKLLSCRKNQLIESRNQSIDSGVGVEKNQLTIFRNQLLIFPFFKKNQSIELKNQ